MKNNFFLKISSKVSNSKFVTGFTLIETLVAISVLMLAIASPMTIAQNGLSTAMYAREKVVAEFLAQDAIEYVKYIRDTRMSESAVLGDHSTKWKNDFALCLNNSGCKIDTNKSSVTAYASTDFLYFHNDTGIYDYDSTSGTKTSYSRKVFLTEDGLVKTLGTDDIQGVTSDMIDAVFVKVIVEWTSKGKLYSFPLETEIFNYR